MNQWDYKIITINTQHQPDVIEWLSAIAIMRESTNIPGDINLYR